MCCPLGGSQRQVDFEKASEQAETLRAAAHPVRLMILAELLEGPKCVTDIRELLKARQPNVSQHLSVLKHAGLVAFSRDGAFRCYYLRKPAQVSAIFRLLESDYPTVSSEQARKKFRRGQRQKARR
jgi:DNA-binding transcriptional ArsR family regulator